MFTRLRIVNNKSIGADQTVHQRLYGHCAKADFGIGDYDTSLYDIAFPDLHLQPLIQNLQIESVLRHLTALYAVFL